MKKGRKNEKYGQKRRKKKTLKNTVTIETRKGKMAKNKR